MRKQCVQGVLFSPPSNAWVGGYVRCQVYRFFSITQQKLTGRQIYGCRKRSLAIYMLKQYSTSKIKGWLKGYKHNIVMQQDREDGA